jgi:hypothetical protein
MKMKRIRFALVILLCQSLTYLAAQPTTNAQTAKKIIADTRLDTIQQKALALLTGFSAGTSYNEVWIRDLNTFIKGSLKVQSPKAVRDMLLLFFKIQGEDGNIVDGLVDTSKAHGGYVYRYSKLIPQWAAHKNTVETDQESSLIQAVKKYLDVTKDSSILVERIDGKTVFQRMEDALNYILNDRWAASYGLVKGATTIDWGDVQPEAGWGVAINQQTKWSIDIYDNAMFAIALSDLLTMKPQAYKLARDWKAVHQSLNQQVRKHLWSAASAKYIPHIYLDGSPFATGFNESKILYTGGSICAIIAGFNTKEEVKSIIKQMLNAAGKEKFASIGMTVYPPYPAEQFPNMHPYKYQNAGDWTWFGGRIAEALIPYGMADDAYKALDPMITRMLKNNGFYEWYNVQTGEPSGSGDFRGEAGVLYDAINLLRHWAAQQ